MKEKDLSIISHLRSNARMALTEIKKRTEIPVSTIFDKLNQHEKDVIRKYTAILDFERLGFNSRHFILITSSPEHAEILRGYLSTFSNVNNFFMINSGYDFLIETVFPNQKETQEFINDLERNFGIKNIAKYNIIEDIHREKFLTQ